MLEYLEENLDRLETILQTYDSKNIPHYNFRGVLVCGIFAYIYVVMFKKSRVSLFDEKDRALAAIFETAGQYFYVFALDNNSVIVAPMIGCYSIVSVLLGRLLLKEKLTLQQYIYIGLVLVGIYVLGVFE